MLLHRAFSKAGAPGTLSEPGSEPAPCRHLTALELKLTPCPLPSMGTGALGKGLAQGPSFLWLSYTYGMEHVVQSTLREMRKVQLAGSVFDGTH